MADLGEYRGKVGPARLDLTHDGPIYQRPRPHSQEEYAAMDAVCKELLGADNIEESRSSGYAVNSTMPPKRAADGTWTQRRFCQDARDLNAATVPDLHLSPLPEELFDQIGDATWLTNHSAEEHLQHLERVFQMLLEIGIQLHPETTLVAGDAVEFLGFMVSAKGLAPTRANVEALLALGPQSSSAGVRRLLGMFWYYRKLVPRFADITAPLNALISSKYVCHAGSWGAEQQAALDELKMIYSRMDGPVLRRVQPARPLILHTDFSGVGMSGILGQLDDDGVGYLCVCISRPLNVHEQRYISYKGELLAVSNWSVTGVQRFGDSNQ
ncbi:hypothetical protein GPECTOR_600g677 [Gonium pectorale]|uniref:Reverse transcriptase/retrotransposon-derived protein RNase H-like domain-containing protein n=1 Tax=Gonium pectorale TaxID=33097 RepID=A0A150FUH3_GONPE|nr:hypothetical protein GPECTOR_600g677 [Gonium pectorale]|eukprot:KXZ41257.1 hypothetical protein GPECTOR_600g677 [Gonium pectorale]